MSVECCTRSIYFVISLLCFFFFKQKTAYEMRISDWSSDVCSSDLFVPVVSPRMLARRLDVTISGAGKLLSRAAELDLLVEVSGRQAWRTYMTRDLAIAFGFGVRPVGRPPAPPQALPDFIPALEIGRAHV